MFTTAEQRASELRSAVADAGKGLAAGLFTFMTVTVYLAVATLATSHADLLAGRTYKLPIFDVDLSIAGFYVMAPLAYLALHVALLARTLVLARRLAQFAAAIRDTGSDGKPTVEEGRRPLLLWLVAPSSLMRYPRAAGIGRADDISGLLFGTIPLVLVPLALLALMQWRFLPYGLWWVTCLHLAVILADIVLLDVFTWKLHQANNELVRAVEGERPVRQVALLLIVPGAATLAGTVCAALLLSQPTFLQSSYRLDPGPALVAARGEATQPTMNWDAFAKRQQLLRCFALGPAPVQGSPTYCAAAHKLTAAGYALLDEPAMRISASFDLRRRNLRGAVLVEADLAGADLTGADLTDADLSRADLRGAKLVGANLTRANLEEAKLVMADLSEANLSFAYARLAYFEGATVYAASFEGANLQGAHLQFLRIDDRHHKRDQTRPATAQPSFVAADLSAAQVQGMSFAALDVREARFDGTLMHAACLEEGDLTRASVARPAKAQASLQTRAARAPTSPISCPPLEALAKYKFVCTIGDGSDPPHDRSPPDFTSIYADAALVFNVSTWEHVAASVARLYKIEKDCRSREPI